MSSESADEGFSKLPRRTNKERGLTKKKSIIPERSYQLVSYELKNQKFHCKNSGIFLFLPYLLKVNLPDIIKDSNFPETSEISKLNYVLSILSLKLPGQERLSQINDFSLDRGLGLFAGLNVLPKSTAISTYSYSIDKDVISRFQETFVKNLNHIDESYYSGETINLDFHTIPHYGEKPPLDNHWSGSRNKALKSAYTFIAQDAESRMTSYINADIKKGEESEEILHFVDYWISVKGIVKETLVFDSRLTNYGVLEKFCGSNIKFITLRRRGSKLVENAFSLPADSWKEIKLNIPKRKYNKFKVFEHVINLEKDGHPVREIIIKDHGREEPTFLVTNNFDFPVETCVELYARRWRIENKIAELVKFFSLNALSSPIVIRIYMDVMLTMVADICYRLFARDINKFENATSQTIFSKFIDVTGNVEIVDNEIIVQLRKNAQAPILISKQPAKIGVKSFDKFISELLISLQTNWNTNKFDFLENNAGIGVTLPIPQVTEEAFDNLMNIHFKGVYFLTQKSLPNMNDNGGVVFISSGTTRFCVQGYSVYSSLKGAVEVFTKYVAKEFGQRGIRANVVAPGAIETDFNHAAIRNNPQMKSFVASQT
ncbi:partial Enoyl-[acyl-carrier-protein] reductase [NADPH] FabL, partial [uncultured bacterium]